MLVKDVMSGDVVSVNSADTIEKAAQLMKLHHIGSIPVCKEGLLIGIVTDRDITLRTVAEDLNTHHKVGDIMTYDPIVGTPEMNVQEATRIMSEKQIRRLPIVQNDSLVGMLSLGDISQEPGLRYSAEDALKNISKDTDWNVHY